MSCDLVKWCSLCRRMAPRDAFVLSIRAGRLLPKIPMMGIASAFWAPVFVAFAWEFIDWPSLYRLVENNMPINVGVLYFLLTLVGVSGTLAVLLIPQHPYIGQHVAIEYVFNKTFRVHMRRLPINDFKTELLALREDLVLAEVEALEFISPIFVGRSDLEIQTLAAMTARKLNGGWSFVSERRSNAFRYVATLFNGVSASLRFLCALLLWKFLKHSKNGSLRQMPTKPTCHWHPRIKGFIITFPPA